MDTKLIRQYGEDILCYRHRSARAKTRAQYTDFHRHLRKLYKEERALWQLQQDLGWEPLVPPVQKGWKRIFVLRQDVAQSKQADFYAGILAKINTTEWSWRKDFKKKKRAFGRKKYLVREQYLLRPSDYHFHKLLFTDAEKVQFYEQWSWDKGQGKFIRRYVFNESWRFVLKVKPNIIYRIRKRDAVIESRLKEIKSYLERTGYGKIQDRLLDHSDKWWKWGSVLKYNEVNQLKNKPLQRILDELKEEIY